MPHHGREPLQGKSFSVATAPDNRRPAIQLEVGGVAVRVSLHKCMCVCVCHLPSAQEFCSHSAGSIKVEFSQKIFSRKLCSKQLARVIELYISSSYLRITVEEHSFLNFGQQCPYSHYYIFIEKESREI